MAQTETAREREIVVFWLRREAICAECGGELASGSTVRVEDKRVLCLSCADLDHLVFLPSGDAALTRRARKYSTLQAVLVEWSRTRKRYERQGVLVEAAAMERAETECLAGAEVRTRRRATDAERRSVAEAAYTAAFAEAILSQFPGCPADEAQATAVHACLKASGRIGRSAEAKALDPEAIRLAVVAHVRHTHTPYDRLLARVGERQVARSEVRAAIDEVLDRWERRR